MEAIIAAMGIGVTIEPLQKFAESLDIDTADKLCNVFVGHRDESKRKEMNALCADTTPWKGLLPQPHAFNSRIKPSFRPKTVIQNIVHVFRTETLVSYLLKDCYLFYQSSHGFEVVVECDLNDRLEKCLITSSHQRKRGRPIANTSDPSPIQQKRVRFHETDHLPSQDIFSENFNSEQKSHRSGLKWPNPSSNSDYNSECVGNSWLVISRSETVSLDLILYDVKQRRQVLRNGGENLIGQIIDTSIHEKIAMLDDWKVAAIKWKKLLGILRELKKHDTNLTVNNGYNRVLRKHLRNTCIGSNGKQLEPISKKCVTSFICDIIRRVVPMQFFDGSNRQRKKFHVCVSQLLNSAKFQKISLQNFVDCFSKMPKWCSEIPSFFRKHLFTKTMKFLVCGFVMSVIKSQFYITECGSTGFELFYYLKCHIEAVSQRQINLLLKIKKIEEMDKDHMGDEAHSDISDLRFPTCKSRFLPKTPESSELRLITIGPKARSKAVEERRTSALTVLVRFLDCVLSHASTGIQPMSSNPQLYNAWQKVARWRDCGQPLYFVKADIKDAFGSVKHEQLRDILDRVCPDATQNWKEIYMHEWSMQRGVLTKTVRSSFSRKVLPKRLLHSRVFANGPGYSTRQLKNAVMQVVTLQNVFMASKVYRVKVGLCQGGVGRLSNRLCDVYYSTMDRMLFADLMDSDECALLRAVDDYLLITSSHCKAERFLNIVKSGIPKFNAQFSKIVTNVAEPVASFSYLGLDFNMSSFNIKPIYRPVGSSVLNSTKMTAYKFYDPRSFKDDFFRRRATSLNSLKLVPVVVEDKWCDVECVVQTLFNACRLHASNCAQLARFLRPADAVILESLGKVLGKIRRLVPQLNRERVAYIYWQSVFAEFRRLCGLYKEVNSAIQVRIIRVYQNLQQWGPDVEQRPGWWLPERKKYSDSKCESAATTDTDITLVE